MVKNESLQINSLSVFADSNITKTEVKTKITMEIDKTFLIISVVFSFLGGLALLTFCADAVKLYYHEVNLLKLDKEIQEKQQQAKVKNETSKSDAQDHHPEEPIEVS